MWLQKRPILFGYTVCLHIIYCNPKSEHNTIVANFLQYMEETNMDSTSTTAYAKIEYDTKGAKNNNKYM